MIYDKLLEKLKQLVGESGKPGKKFKSPNEFADKHGIKAAKIYETLKGSRVPQAKDFLSWFDLLDEPVYIKDDLSLLNQNYEPVPKVQARLSAGGGSFETEDDIKGWYAFRKAWMASRNVSTNSVLMKVAGDSMAPTLLDGDLVMVDQNQNSLINGKIYAIGIEEAVFVKRVERRPNVHIFLSDNPDYGKEEIQDGVYEHFRILGRVVWSCRDL